MNTPAPLPFSPAAERNGQPILAALRELLPPSGLALEVASGTGQHAVFFAQGLPGWHWQPSDANAHMLPAIAARTALAQLDRVRPPLHLDVQTPPWVGNDPVFDAIFCANMLHIAPWSACAGLMQLAAQHLTPGGLLVVYGPFFESDALPSPGNVAFDHSLRAQNPEWGVRPLSDVDHQAQLAGLARRHNRDMPANNRLLVWSPADNPRP